FAQEDVETSLQFRALGGCLSSSLAPSLKNAHGPRSMDSIDTNWNDHSWNDRSCYCCHAGHGLERGHGNKSSPCAPREEADPRGIGASGGGERAVPRFN